MTQSRPPPYRTETRWFMPARYARSSPRPRKPCSDSRYVYDTAEQCEARFKGDDPGFIYSHSNPTVAMSSSAWLSSKGAETARATATGMAAVTPRCSRR